MFFFSSRRRHTRLQGDWSSDVCSSDLVWAFLATATDAKKAHTEMLPNPSDLRVVDQTCGKCHQAITAKVKSSIMAHRSGTQSGTLFPNRLQPTKEDVRFAMAPVATTPGLPLPN